MSTKNKIGTLSDQHAGESIHLSAIDDLLDEPDRKGLMGFVVRHWVKGAVGIFVVLLTIGVFANKGWLPHTDSLTGKRTGWFGAELPKNSKNTWNPFASSFSTPTPPPPLSKEYIYAGSRLLAVEDANANAIPPADLAVWRPSGEDVTGEWIVLSMGEAVTIDTYGEPGDIPVQGDYDGDGKTDFAYYRPDEDLVNNIWYTKYSSDGSEHTVGSSQFGNVPAQADYDGDGKTDLATFKSIGHTWTIIYSSNGATPAPTPFGANGDKPVPADYDGDGKADFAVWHSSTHTFTALNSSDGQTQTVSLTNSTSTDIPVCADYDGDGKADFAVLSGTNWIIRSSSLGSTGSTTWPTSGSAGTPVPNDYDNDGKVDLAIVRGCGGLNNNNLCWYIRQSHDSSNPRTETFGKTGDVPVPAYYKH